jgi:hypothetical protein
MASFKSRKLKQFKKQKKQRNNKTRHTKYKYRRNTLKQTKRKSYRKTLSYYNVRKIFGGAPTPIISVSGEVMSSPRKSPRLPPSMLSFPAPSPPPHPERPEVYTPGPSLPPFTQVYTRAPSSPPSLLLLLPSPPLPSLPEGFSDAAPPPSPPPDIIMINLFSNQAIIAGNAVLWPLLCIILLFCCYRRRRRNSDLDTDPRRTNIFRGGGFNGTSILTKISRLSIDREHLQQTISPFLNFLRVDDHREPIRLLLNIDKDTNLEILIDTIVLKSGFTKLPTTETQPLSPQSQKLPFVVVDTDEAQRIDIKLQHYASINIDDIDDNDINNIISVLSNILNLYLVSPDKSERKVKLLLAYMSFIQDYMLVSDSKPSDSKPVNKFSTHLTKINRTSGLDKIEIDYNSLKNIYDSL